MFVDLHEGKIEPVNQVDSVTRNTTSEEPDIVQKVSQEKAAKLQQTCLTKTTVVDLTDDGPVFVDRFDHGNVSPFAFVLKATASKSVADYLISCKRDEEWAFHLGSGETALDSALVLDSFFELSEVSQNLVPGLESLLTNYRRDEGGFRATNARLADYWDNLCIVTTSLLGFLLGKFKKSEFQAAAKESRQVVGDALEGGAFWRSPWQSSTLVPTYYALRCLRQNQQQYREKIAQVVESVGSRQRADGSWNRSTLDTAVGLLILQMCNGVSQSRAVHAAEEWLRQGDDSSQQPLSHSWFDIGNGQRRFLYQVDKGYVAESWKKIALREH